VRILVLMGAVTDFVLGVFINFRVQNVPLRLRIEGNSIAVQAVSVPSIAAVKNAALKQYSHVTFLGDHLGGLSTALQVAAAVFFVLLLVEAGRQALRRPKPGR